MHKTVKYVAAALFLLTLVSLLAGCTGSTSEGGGPDDFNGTIYVPGDDSGSISLTVDLSPGNRMPVGGVTDFIVKVRNSDGGPVAQAPVICGTEEGLEIVDPEASGLVAMGITDAFGTFSGVVGCVSRGSRQMACEVANTTKRQFISIVCTGGA